jgi:putative ABC transport system ATP-binding protein/macrolide transport system ATP-binding/permease protein/lipoprotein-releasing system ATP-binding protein
MTGLRAEIKDVTFGPGKSYDVSVYLQNTNATQPIYVLSPTVRGFVQVGTSWQEVSLKPVSASPQKVLKITGEQIYHYTFESNITDYAQLFPYYMHVRFTNDMLVSSSSQPKSDLVERSDSYYVYLKPHEASDDAIMKKMHFPGKPPVWIPMPPH